MSISPHGIPSIQLRAIGSYVDRLASIQRDAEEDGLGTLAYLVDVALLEARAVVARAEAEKAAHAADPGELWRPV